MPISNILFISQTETFLMSLNIADDEGFPLCCDQFRRDGAMHMTHDDNTIIFKSYQDFSLTSFLPPCILFLAARQACLEP